MNQAKLERLEGTEIRAAEDSLFQEWALRRRPFANDGCADPISFTNAPQKIVFVLKERNWGHSTEKQRRMQDEGCENFVDEREIYSSWWTQMAQWADVLLPNKDACDYWHQIQASFAPTSEIAPEDREQWINERNKKALGKCACIQLKKAPSGGELNKADFGTVVTEDKSFILRQFALYSPHFIISCGSNDNWNIFTSVLFDHPRIEQSRNGINYFVVDFGAKNHKTAVVNFAHPSMRVNATLWGTLAYGLRDSLAEILPRLSSAEQFAEGRQP